MTSDTTSNASAYGDNVPQFDSNVGEIVPMHNEYSEAVLPMTFVGDGALNRYEIDFREGLKLLKVFEYPKLRSGEDYDVISKIVILEANNKLIRVAAIVINREVFPNKRDITNLNVLRKFPEHYDALSRQLNESESKVSHVFQATLRHAKDIVLVGVDQPLRHVDSNAVYKIMVYRSKFTLQRKQRVSESENLVQERVTPISNYNADGSKAKQKRSLMDQNEDTNGEAERDDGDQSMPNGQSMLYPLLGVSSALALFGLSYFAMNKGMKSRTETGRSGKYSSTKNLK